MNPNADVILRAAKLMRQRAEAATPGPWLSMDGGDRLVHDPGHDYDPPVYVVNEPMTNAANAEYIAAMHPLVALTLAAWMESCAGDLATTGRLLACDEPGAVVAARDIAMEYLRDEELPS